MAWNGEAAMEWVAEEFADRRSRSARRTLLAAISAASSSAASSSASPSSSHTAPHASGTGIMPSSSDGSQMSRHAAEPRKSSKSCARWYSSNMRRFCSARRALFATLSAAALSVAVLRAGGCGGSDGNENVLAAAGVAACCRGSMETAASGGKPRSSLSSGGRAGEARSGMSAASCIGSSRAASMGSWCVGTGGLRAPLRLGILAGNATALAAAATSRACSFTRSSHLRRRCGPSGSTLPLHLTSHMSCAACHSSSSR